METRTQDLPVESSMAYPWGVDWEADDSPVEHFWTLDLKSSPSALWPLLADTGAVNERLGLPKITFEERGGQLYGSSGKFFARQEWLELPWEWEIEKSLTAERRYSKGFARTVRVRYLLNNSGGGTRLTLYFGWIPRRWWARPLLRRVNRWLEKRYTCVLAELDELASAPTTRPEFCSAAQPARTDESRLARGLFQLEQAGISPIEINRLATHIREASDNALFRIRPKMLAFEWGMKLDEVLSVLLHSTKAGLLSIAWDVMCPHCQGVRREAQSLGDLRELGRCDVCDIDFNATTQESIEVTFKVQPEIRQIREVFYCSAEPAKKPHIVLQQNIAPSEIYSTHLTLTEGRYRLRSATGDSPPLSLEIAPAEGAVEVCWDVNEAGREFPIAINHEFKLVTANSGAESQSIVLEKLADDPSALRPSEVFNLQQFRNLFSEESIASGLKLEVGAQTLLFTDIVGSTALYADLGDAKAFKAVHAHFVALHAIVAFRNGAVVKTIGDAMMAAFPRPEQALQAAIEIQQMFRPGEQDIALRISIHRGMCLAVCLDSNIDYFGSAVNYAANMQSITGAGEIALSKEFYALPDIAEEARKWELEIQEKPFRLGKSDVALLVSAKS